MPIISKAQMDKLGCDILEEYMPEVLKEPQTIDIRHLVEDGIILDIWETAFPIQNILGMVAFDDVKIPIANDGVLAVHEGTIVLASHLHNKTTKWRFTAAHEASHWVLHRQYFSPSNNTYSFRQSQYSYISSKNDDSEKGKKNPKEAKCDDDWQEWQADYLAAAILMPKTTFIEAARSSLKRHGFHDMRLVSGENIDGGTRVIKELADIFQVSMRSVRIRMRQFAMYVGDCSQS